MQMKVKIIKDDYVEEGSIELKDQIITFNHQLYWDITICEIQKQDDAILLDQQYLLQFQQNPNQFWNLLNSINFILPCYSLLDQYITNAKNDTQEFLEMFFQNSYPIMDQITHIYDQATTKQNQKVLDQLKDLLIFFILLTQEDILEILVSDDYFHHVIKIFAVQQYYTQQPTFTTNTHIHEFSQINVRLQFLLDYPLAIIVQFDDLCYSVFKKMILTNSNSIIFLYLHSEEIIEIFTKLDNAKFIKEFVTTARQFLQDLSFIELFNPVIQKTSPLENPAIINHLQLIQLIMETNEQYWDKFINSNASITFFQSLQQIDDYSSLLPILSHNYSDNLKQHYLRAMLDKEWSVDFIEYYLNLLSQLLMSNLAHIRAFIFQNQIINKCVQVLLQAQSIKTQNLMILRFFQSILNTRDQIFIKYFIHHLHFEDTLSSLKSKNKNRNSMTYCVLDQLQQQLSQSNKKVSDKLECNTQTKKIKLF